jgi:D-glucosaminate-6-phosphate ammonia-lyase
LEEKMSVLQKLGLRPIINASATLTKLGGSVMPPEVVEAIVDASRAYVDVHELQRRIGERIAELTHNEAAYVSSGAAAGLVLATAACITGMNPAAMAQLPDLTGLKNEVIVHRSHRNGYDHAVRQVGVKLVEIGVGGTYPWELEAAINENTAAIFWFQGGMTGHGDLPLETVIEIANRHDIPVVVDAAAQLPPVENLWRFTQMGAALVVFSGGKELRGPQSSGLVLGRKDLIEACRLNGSPNHSIGRPMKVGKEEMAGCLAAVERYVKLDHKAKALADEETVAVWCAAWNQIPGVKAQRSFPNEAGQPLPRVHATFSSEILGLTRDEIVAELHNGEHQIEVALGGKDGIYFNPWVLNDEERQIVQDRLVEIVGQQVAVA